MRRGYVDEFTSRRTTWLECEYWAVAKDELNKDKSVLAHEKTPQGRFSAKVEDYENNTSSVISQSFLFDTTDLSISTNDYIPDIKKNYIVRCVIDGDDNDIFWRIESLTRTPIRGNYEYKGSINFKTRLELRR